MHTLNTSSLPSRLLDQVATALAHCATALRAVAGGLDAWLTERERHAIARHDLALMNDRELQDIGVNRASVEAIAVGCWTRDFPR